MSSFNDGRQRIIFELREKRSQMSFEILQPAGEGIGTLEARFTESDRAPMRLSYCGNFRLLESSRAAIPLASSRNSASATNTDVVKMLADQLVFVPMVIVCGIHTLAQVESALVALRWGCPRIMLLPGHLHLHLGSHLDEEPEQSFLQWRSHWDGSTDLALSLQTEDSAPDGSTSNWMLDRTIREIATHQIIFKTRVGIVPEFL
jgi:hypothetical protein